MLEMVQKVAIQYFLVLLRLAVDLVLGITPNLEAQVVLVVVVPTLVLVQLVIKVLIAPLKVTLVGTLAPPIAEEVVVDIRVQEVIVVSQRLVPLVGQELQAVLQEVL